MFRFVGGVAKQCQAFSFDHILHHEAGNDEDWLSQDNVQEC
jgi:hypothetical protein